MKAIILAAGKGKRLRPLTKKIPKPLVKVSGFPILSYQINALINLDITNIIICVGYKGKKIIEFCNSNYSNVDFTFINKSNLQSTNNLYSLYLAEKYLKKDILLMNGDVIFDKEILEGMIKKPYSQIAVDKNNYLKESMKIKLDDSGYVKSISKEISEEHSYGSSIDIYLIKENELIFFKEIMKKIIEIDKKLDVWTEFALNKTLKNENVCFLPFEINDLNWIEIDDYDDLNKSKDLFN